MYRSRSSSLPRVLFFDGSLEQYPRRQGIPRRSGMRDRGVQRRKPWLPTARRARAQCRADCSGGETAPGALAPAATRRPHGRRAAETGSRVRTGGGPGVGLLGPGRRSGIAPQRVREDPDGSAGGSDVLDLTRGNPVINRATADSDSFAGLHDREGLAVHICSRASTRRPSKVSTTGPQGPKTTSRSCIGCKPPILSAACVNILAPPT
jgi:hypothetical protein